MASSGPSSRKLPRTDKKPAPSSSSSNYSATFDDDFFRRRKRRERQESGGGGGGGGGIAPAKPRSPVKPRSPKKVPTPPAPRRPATSRRPVAPPSPPLPPPPSLSSPPRSRPPSSSSSTSARSPKRAALVEQLPAPLADIVFGGLSDDELASLVRRSRRPHEYVGYSTQPKREEKKSGGAASLSASGSASRTVAEFRPRPYAPSSPRLSDDLNRSFESLHIRCRSTCAQQWRQIVAERLRQTAAAAATSENEERPTSEDERDREALENSAPLPICARLCAADVDPVLELVRAYRDELHVVIRSDGALVSDRTAHGVAYADSNVWELGYEPFLRFHSSSRNVLGLPFRLAVKLRAETDTRRAAVERLRLVVETDFRRQTVGPDVWDPERKEWSSDRTAAAHKHASRAGRASEQRVAARRAWRAFMIGDAARTTADVSGAATDEQEDAVDFVATGSERYEWVGPDNARTWRDFARVIAILHWAAAPVTLYATATPPEREDVHKPSSLPLYLRLVRAAFPETPVVVQYADPFVEQRGDSARLPSLRVPNDRVVRLVAAAHVPNVTTQIVRASWQGWID